MDAERKSLHNGSAWIDKDHRLTAEKIKRFLPKKSTHELSERVLEKINNMGEHIGVLDSDMDEMFLTHINVLDKLKIPMEKYVDALKYVALTNHMSNKKAFEIVFPDRMEKLRLQQERANLEGTGRVINVDAHVTSFNKSEAVTEIRANAMLASHIEYNWMFHQQMHNLHNISLGKTADGIQVGAVARVQAMSKILEITQMPQAQQIDVKVGMDEDSKSMYQQMMEQVTASASAQLQRLQGGASVKDVQKLNININEPGEEIIDV
jgi:hypothetical protein